MARIQITDLNPSNFGLMEEPTDKKLLEINGGGWLNWVVGIGLIVGGVLTESSSFITAGLDTIKADPSFP